MSAWSSADGVVYFSKDNHHCSLEKLIKGLYDEINCNVKRVAINAYEVSFNFSLENEAAFKVIQEFVKQVKEHDKNATIDIDATIRYIG